MPYENTFFVILYVAFSSSQTVVSELEFHKQCLNKDQCNNLPYKSMKCCNMKDYDKLNEYSEKKLLNSGNSMSGLYRPRSALARALYDKQRHDELMKRIDKHEWYRVEKGRLDPDLVERFIQLNPDDETKQFINQAIHKSSRIWTQIWYLVAKAFLKYFWSITDINGWLGRGSMFVLSADQARTMLRQDNGTEAHYNDGSQGVMMDLGAGDGEVSLRWNSLFTKMYATEISDKMQLVLTTKGFELLDIQKWWCSGIEYNTICMLNLLDRCSTPVTILKNAKRALRPRGRILVALVLPFKPYVEVNVDHRPEEYMNITGKTFEEQVKSFVNLVKNEIGLKLIRWSRVPYLCEGDFTQSYYWLDDAVFVFESID